MKKGLKKILAVAGLLMAAGLVLMGAGRLMGTSFRELAASGALKVINESSVTLDGPDFDNEYREDGCYLAAPKGVESLSVDWIWGDVTVSAYDGAEITFREENLSGERYALTQDNALRWGVKDGTLYIRFCKSGKTRNIGAKSLEVLLPEKLAAALNRCELSASSADITATGLAADVLTLDTTTGEVAASGMTAREGAVSTTSGSVRLSGGFQRVNVGSTSGDVTLEQTGKTAADGYIGTTSGSVALSGNFRTLEVSTTSGNIGSAERLSAAMLSAETNSGETCLAGHFEQIKADATSGDVDISSDVCPGITEVCTTSGEVRLTLPQGSGFTLERDTVSGDLRSDFSLRIEGEEYVAGNGRAQMEIDTTSGDLSLFAS